MRWAFLALFLASSPAFAAGEPADPVLEIQDVLMILAGAVVGPIVTSLLKRFSWIDPQLGAVVNIVATMILYVLAWGLVTGGDREMLWTYVAWALAAAGIGGAANNFYRKRVSH